MLRIGIIGGANIAVRSVIPALLELPNDFKIVGVASKSLLRSNEIKEKFGIKIFNDYDSLISKKYVDAVYIPLPNAFHYEWVSKALQRNIHVLVEKSLACTPNEVINLSEIALRNNLALVENFQFRFHKQLQKIINILDSGQIGELRSLRSSFGFPPFTDRDNIRYSKSLGGGALLDAGAYPLKIAQIFLGDQLKVSSATLNTKEGFEVDIWGGAFLKQLNGPMFAEISFGFDNFYQCNIELWGNKGKVVANRIFTAPPGYEPIIEVYTDNGVDRIIVPADNHFINMLTYFLQVTRKKQLQEEEIQANICQSKLLYELRTLSNG